MKLNIFRKTSTDFNPTWEEVAAVCDWIAANLRVPALFASRDKDNGETKE